MLSTISVENLLYSVKMTLRSFDDAGLLDDGELMRHSDWITNRLGLSMLEEIYLVLDVENFKAPIPFNLKQLDFVYACDVKPNQENFVKYYYGNPHTFTVQDYTKKLCYNKCSVEEELTEIKRVISIEGAEHVKNYANKRILKPSKSVSKDKCTKNCLNLNCDSPEYFDMDEKNIYLNFKEGSIYIKYYGSRLDDEGYPLILDDPYVTKAIEDYLVYKGLQTIYYNSEVDVIQRMQLAKLEHDSSLREALFNDKLPEYKRMLKYADLRAGSVEIFNLPSLADANRKQHKGYYQRHK